MQTHELMKIYLDASKAFNSAPHNELQVELWSTGITDG